MFLKKYRDYPGPIWDARNSPFCLFTLTHISAQERPVRRTCVLLKSAVPPVVDGFLLRGLVGGSSTQGPKSGLLPGGGPLACHFAPGYLSWAPWVVHNGVQSIHCDGRHFA